MCRWEPVDVEGRLQALFTIFLYRGPEHPRISVSARGPGITPLADTEGQLRFGGVLLYTDFRWAGVSTLNPPRWSRVSCIRVPSALSVHPASRGQECVPVLLTVPRAAAGTQ